MTLLRVGSMTVRYGRGPRSILAVDDVSFTLDASESLGLVGESGCGKSSIAHALLRLHGPDVTVTGSVTFEGRELLTARPQEMRRVRGARLAMISQAAMHGLNPVVRVGEQVAEVLRLHEDPGRREAERRVAEMFERVGLPTDRRSAYPHELSGGMRQRVAIAMGLIARPRIVVADEPTTALDVVIQAQVVDTIVALQAELGFGLLLISHDIGMIADTCDRVVVMYAGQLMEVGAATDVLERSAHPYTQALLASEPALNADRAVIGLPGATPIYVERPAACCFAGRCGRRDEVCRHAPAMTDVAATHQARCHFAGAAALGRQALESPVGHREVGTTHLVVRDARKSYDVRGGVLSRLLSLDAGEVRALDGVDLELQRGEILALVGESGCGKTTLARSIAGLERLTSGSVTLDGSDVTTMSRRQRTAVAQVVFQDPFRSLDPRKRVRASVAEPLVHHGIGGAKIDARVRRALDAVELRPVERFIDRFPHELSGGQRQRVVIARAVVLEPELIVADEPVSMLDVSVRAGIMNLMLRMRDELGVGFIVITHDLRVARYVADRIAVLYLGRVVESGPAADVIDDPRHPYTRALLAAVPGRRSSRELPPLGEPPSAARIPSGCRFHPRCPSAMERCTTEDPMLVTTGRRQLACHLAG